jgi:hypothetical protein
VYRGSCATVIMLLSLHEVHTYAGDRVSLFVRIFQVENCRRDFDEIRYYKIVISPFEFHFISKLFNDAFSIEIIEYGAVGGMKIGRVNRSTRRKSAPVPLCPPRILHDPT